MENTKMVSPAELHEDLELDPLLWKELPQELLERVITKLPFSRAVALRQVCKLWKSDVIPRTARVEASKKPALLYFNFVPKFRYSEPAARGLRWLQLRNSNLNGKTSSVHKFQPSTFPSPKRGEIIQIVSSQGGLLFFAFIRGSRLGEIVVSNPLTSQSRSLGLPRPLICHYSDPNLTIGVFFGVVMDAKTKTYLLVVAGRELSALNKALGYVTFLYRSSTSTWSTGPSLSPAFAALAEIRQLAFREDGPSYFSGNRSVCHGGNLYWKALFIFFGHHIVMFDVEEATWRIFPVLFVECKNRWGYWEMVNYEEEICTWHVHEGLEYGDRVDNSQLTSSIPLQVLFDRNYARYPREVERLCDNDDRGFEQPRLGQPFKAMDDHVIHGLEKILTTEGNFVQCRPQYFAFSQNGVLYHVMRLHSSEKKAYLKVIAHDIAQNSYAQLEGFPEDDKEGSFSPSAVWDFTASLTSFP